MGDGNQLHPSTKFTWRISDFTKSTETRYSSDTFVAGGAAWKLYVYPKGTSGKNLSIYLTITDSEILPLGWSREAIFGLTLVNQHIRSHSITKYLRHKFNYKEIRWGFTNFICLNLLKKESEGFLVNDTVVVEADIKVINAHPPIIDTTTSGLVPTVTHSNLQCAASINRLNTYFANIDKFIKNNTIFTTKEGLTSEPNHETPDLEDIRQAKQSLKECLNDLSKPNIKEKFAKALSTLSLATDGLSDEEQKAVVQFWANYDDLISDRLVFEQENTEFKLQNLMKNNMFLGIEKNYKIHLSYKQSHDELFKEEEELTKRIQEVKSKRIKLMLDWDVLMKKSEEAESNYKIQEKKVVDAEERKRSIEEEMPLATMRWANLKKHFG